jgi:hypothetical protein
MLALGILTVHVALDTRVGSRTEAGLRASESEELECVVTFGTVIVVLERIMGSSTPLDPTPVGCAYPFPPATLLASKGYGGFDNSAGTGAFLIEVAPKEFVMAVTLEYGAKWLD